MGGWVAPRTAEVGRVKVLESIVGSSKDLLMTNRDDTMRSGKRLENVVRRAFRGEQVEAATVAWVRGVEPHELYAARISVANAMFKRLIAKTTAIPIYPSDVSVPSTADLLEDISEWLAFAMMEEMGVERAAGELEELAMSLRTVF